MSRRQTQHCKGTVQRHFDAMMKRDYVVKGLAPPALVDHMRLSAGDLAVEVKVQVACAGTRTQSLQDFIDNRVLTLQCSSKEAPTEDRRCV